MSASVQPAHFLDDGSRAAASSAQIRVLDADDGAATVALLERLTPESRRRRFLTPMPSLGARHARVLAAIDGHDHLAVGAEVSDPGAPGGRRLVGVARAVRYGADAPTAEVAVEVEDALHGLGLGTRLVRALAALSVERGVDEWVASMLAENRAVRRVLRRVVPEAAWAIDGPGVFETRYRLVDRAIVDGPDRQASKRPPASPAGGASGFRAPVTFGPST